jgi:hypothetical protein
VLGLVHDLPEVFVGDIPTHTKRHLTGVKELEKATIPVVFIEENTAPTDRLLVKLCDLADGIRFIRLHGVDITADHAREGLEAQLIDRWQEAGAGWPVRVVGFVADTLRFYCYEQT